MISFGYLAIAFVLCIIGSFLFNFLKNAVVEDAFKERIEFLIANGNISNESFFDFYLENMLHKESTFRIAKPNRRNKNFRFQVKVMFAWNTVFESWNEDFFDKGCEEYILKIKEKVKKLIENSATSV